MGKMKGNTGDASTPILKQAFFHEGLVLNGKVIREFQTNTGNCYELLLGKAIVVDPALLSSSEPLTGKQTLTRVGIGAMKGLNMAINNAGTDRLHPEDVVSIKCLGETDTGKANPRTDFEIEIDRPDPRGKAAPAPF